MEYTFKGKVKKLIAEKDNYHVSFSYSDTFKIEDKSYGIAIERDKIDKLEEAEKFSVEKELFDFISAHAKEELLITYKSDNKNKRIVKVELIYE